MATASNDADAIKGMIKEWNGKNGKMTLLPDLAESALRVGINPADIVLSCPTTTRRGKCKKAATPSARDGIVKGILLGRRFFSQACGPTLKKKQG